MSKMSRDTDILLARQDQARTDKLPVGPTPIASLIRYRIKDTGESIPCLDGEWVDADDVSQLERELAAVKDLANVWQASAVAAEARVSATGTQSASARPSSTEVPAGYVRSCEAAVQYLSDLLHDIEYDRNDWRNRVHDFSQNGLGVDFNKTLATQSATGVQPEGRMNWIPVSTSPKESGWYQVWTTSMPDRLRMKEIPTYYFESSAGYWGSMGSGVPTHWMPLPSAPENAPTGPGSRNP